MARMRTCNEMRRARGAAGTCRFVASVAIVVALGAAGAFVPANVDARTRAAASASRSVLRASDQNSIYAFEGKTEYCRVRASCSARRGRAWNRAFLAQMGPSLPLDMACVHTYNSHGVRHARFIHLLSYIFSSRSYARGRQVRISMQARPDSATEGTATGSLSVRGKRIINGRVRIHLVGTIQHWRLEGAGNPSGQTWVADQSGSTTGSMDCSIAPRKRRGVVHSTWQHFTTACYCSAGYKSDAIDF